MRPWPFFLTPCKSSAPAQPIPRSPATINSGMTPLFSVYTISYLLFMILGPLALIFVLGRKCTISVYSRYAHNA
ncbi:hypothetical protein K503DRAFT_89477 [Rhizopogon vinicolor AM-OR11-026]|uniref:Uncharacterized protein n=1 Tax=Rhizopogon vinicolor AM-OR11-026 TaxID=1314800 RepID=A0A1B7NFS7_9AGAM|nr:hypothetical protein K503DRAFT_89477 [Rhizopogon vinicolor AM-OR11-026]